MDEKYTLKVGETRRFGNLWSSVLISYAGMPQNDRYSIVHHTLVGEGMEKGTNYYYDTSQKEFELRRKQFRVLQVTPEEMIIQYLK